MTEQILIETRNSRTKTIEDYLIPHITKGFQTMFNQLNKLHKDSSIVNFQIYLSKMPVLTKDMYDDDYKFLLKNANMTDQTFEKLIYDIFLINHKMTAVIDNKSTDFTKIIGLPTGKEFVKRCYVNSARMIYEIPFIFHPKNRTIENLDKITSIISSSINKTIRELLILQTISYDLEEVEVEVEVDNTNPEETNEDFNSMSVIQDLNDEDDEDVKFVKELENKKLKPENIQQLQLELKNNESSSKFLEDLVNPISIIQNKTKIQEDEEELEQNNEKVEQNNEEVDETIVFESPNDQELNKEIVIDDDIVFESPNEEELKKEIVIDDTLSSNKDISEHININNGNNIVLLPSSKVIDLPKPVYKDSIDTNQPLNTTSTTPTPTPHITPTPTPNVTQHNSIIDTIHKTPNNSVIDDKTHDNVVNTQNDIDATNNNDELDYDGDTFVEFKEYIKNMKLF